MIKSYINKIIEKKASYKELITDHIQTIKDKDVDLNTFITNTFEDALAKAEQLDISVSKSEDLKGMLHENPLLGIPVAYKDIFSTKNIETTAASKILKGYIPPYSATSVRKLEDAGVISLGKLNCDAFAHGASGENSDFGNTLNPYDKTCVPGGSSSGTGASVAAGFTLMSMGTDTGGSLRNPASFTNTVAIKPTYGRVSRFGVISMASSLDTIGHITNTVEDSALVLNATAGFDPNDATSSNDDVPNYLSQIGESIKGLKIGIPKEYFNEAINPEVSKITKESIKVMEKLGAEIVDISLPNSEKALAAYYIIMSSEVSSNLARFDGIRFGQDRDQFGAEAKRRIMLGTYALSSGYYDAYYLKAQKIRTLIIQDFEKAFENVDMLLAPVSPVLPPKIGENIDDPMKMYMMDILTVPVNLAGLPALSVPAGFSESCLPVGIQLIGKQFDESNLYKAGYAYEQATKFYERRAKL